MKPIVFFAAAFVLSACAEPQPAPDLPTRASTEFNIETISDNLGDPWSVAPLPGGGYLVTEKAGALKRFGADGVATSISGLPNDIYTEQQAGLFDVVLAPSFATDGIVYISYAYGDARANGTAVIRARVQGDTLIDSRTIFKASPPKDTASHFGGRIVVMPDETLIVTLGEGFAYREEAQNLGSHLGSIVRINGDGTVPKDNPFIGAEEALPEIYSYGHRNVQGAYYDAETARLWAHEHGPRGGDELNLIKPGENYGWPIATTGTDYTGAKITPFKSYSDMADPVHDWVPSIAPSGLVIYRGDMFSNWDGDALVGALAGQSLRRVDLDGDKAVSEETLLGDLNARIRDVRLDNDGAVLVLTNAKAPEAGKLLRITPKR